MSPQIAFRKFSEMKSVAIVYVILSHVRAFQLPLATVARTETCSPGNLTDGILGKARCNENGKVFNLISSSFSYTFLCNITVKGTTFLTQIDSGSWIAAWPYDTISGYTGPTVSSSAYTIPSTAKSKSQAYGDGSSWSGKIVTVPVTLTGTSLTSDAQIALMTSEDRFLAGNYQGILGIGMDGDAKVGVKTVVDSWYASGLMPSNRIAIHGCPLAYSNKGYVDFGDETPYSACGGVVNKVIMPPASGYYSVNFSSFLVAGVPASMGSTWQSTMLSIVDSGTSMLYIPSPALAALQLAVYNSGGLGGTASQKNLFLYSGNVFSAGIVSNWTKLPNITVRLTSYGTNGNLDLVLGPKQYILEYTEEYYVFAVGTIGSFGILGTPVHMAYHLVMDRDNRTVNFQLGCGCESSTDGYPAMQKIAQTEGNCNS